MTLSKKKVAYTTCKSYTILGKFLHVQVLVSGRSLRQSSIGGKLQLSFYIHVRGNPWSYLLK